MLKYNLQKVRAWIAAKETALLPEGSLRSRFLVGSFWALTGTVISQGLQLAATIVVARWLGKTAYGEIGIVKSTVGMCGVFVGLGLGLTATKYVSEHRREDPARAGRIASLTLSVALVSGSVVTAALILLSPWLATHTLASPAVATPLAIGGGLLFFGEVNGVQLGILAGLEAFGPMAKVSLWSGLWSFPITVTGAWLWGITGAVSGLVVSLAVTCVLTHLVLRRETAKAGISFSHFATLEESAVLWDFSTPAFLASAVVTPATWFCNTLLVNRANGYAEMGLFSAADQWRNVVVFLPGVISRVVLPILSSHSKDSVEGVSQFSNTLDAGFCVGVLVAFPAIAALSFGGSIIAKFYGADFSAMRYPLAGLLYAAGVIAIGTPIGNALQAKGAMWFGFANNLVWALLLVGSFRLVFFARGAMGLSLAWGSSYFLLSVSFTWLFCKLGYFPWRLGVRTTLACVCLVVFAFAPLCFPANFSLELLPVALALSLVNVWLLLPSKVRAKALLAADWVAWKGERRDLT
jgi:O-antigen/teichoic acid export membrane protein